MAFYTSYGEGTMDKDNLLSMDDLADVFAQMKDLKIEDETLTEEEKASQRRYEEIIKKHKHDNEKQ